MQSEESHDRSSKETSPSEMTIDLDEVSSSSKHLKQCNSRLSSSEVEFPFDRIKLESYIEKVIPDSPQSSDSAVEDDSKLKEILSKVPANWQDDVAGNFTGSSTPDPFKGSHQEEANPNESIRSWLQRITQMQNEIQKKIQTDPAAVNSISNGRALQQDPLTFSSSPNANTTTTTTTTKSVPYVVPNKPSRVVTYDDLPYMGEMTLDNSKPRRGRKPKKADICHLIYKNYGTIFPGAPDASRDLIDSEITSKRRSASQKTAHQGGAKSNVQNKIISSLLEKRLTQETQRKSATTDSYSVLSNTVEDVRKSPLRATNVVSCDGVGGQDEPLNLCIKDLNQLKIRLLRRQSSSYSSGVESTPDIKTEPQSDDEVEFINETSSFLSHQDICDPSGKIPQLNLPGDISPADVSEDLKSLSQDNKVAPGGYIYWPNAGVFIHPIALQQQLMYYQRMAANNSYTLPSPRPLPESPTSSAAKSPGQLRKLAPKTRLKSIEDQEGHAPEISNKVKRHAASGTATSSLSSSDSRTPVKRKRSAIFIPPIPAENQTNPATEVSICKFKFTGGAKPSLQEKKMLSVDSGGNFRYYSGTGDKSMRGYEFFPRETLQQQIESAHGSSTGAFLQASGEKIYPNPVDFSGNHHHHHQGSGGNKPSEFILGVPGAEIPPVPHSSVLPVAALSPPVSVGSPNCGESNIPASASSRHKSKRKSRKSLQREKLEQTFKEKGFLIQTQQLESAEGATYCKFRQLRKFTRYLFRSWKDYLPGNVRDLQDEEEEADADVERLCGISPAGVLSSASSGDIAGPM